MNSPHAYKFRTFRHDLYTHTRRFRDTQLSQTKSFLSAEEDELAPWDTSSMAIRPIRKPSTEDLQVNPSSCNKDLMSTRPSNMNKTQYTPKSANCSPHSNHRTNNFNTRVILLPNSRKARSLSPRQLNNIKSPKNGGVGEEAAQAWKVPINRKPSLRTRMRQFFTEKTDYIKPLENSNNKTADEQRKLCLPIAYPLMETPQDRKLSVRQHRQLMKARFMNHYTRNVDPARR